MQRERKREGAWLCLGEKEKERRGKEGNLSLGDKTIRKM